MLSFMKHLLLYPLSDIPCEDKLLELFEKLVTDFQQGESWI